MNNIVSITPNSIAEEMGIEAGDILVSINGKKIKDVFDYRFLSMSEEMTVVIKKPDGEEWELEIEKDEHEDLGLVFETGLMDKPRACANKCIFCFIDQLPSGMRESLYFKDDDARLSFLTGNYVTLTNASKADIDRIIYYRFSPINISLHTTDMDLRVQMLGNKKASNIMDIIARLADAGIMMNLQIVLVKGVNDGEKLERSISDLRKFMPYANSLSVVPVGLSAHRDHLPCLKPFTKQDAIDAIAMIDRHRSESPGFVYAADEFYLLAGQGIPDIAYYDDFPQIENGVGMLASFRDEFEQAKHMAEQDIHDNARNTGRIAIVTGYAADAFLRDLLHSYEHVDVFPIENRFLGSSITVSGLLTGRDIIDQVHEKLAEQLSSHLNIQYTKVLIPANAFKADEDIMLDDINLKDIQDAIKIPVEKVAVDGRALWEAIR